MIYTRQQLRELAESRLKLSGASEDRLAAFMAATSWLSTAIKAGDGLDWEVVRSFLELVTRIAESNGEMVGWDNTTLLGHKAIDVLSSTLDSAHRELHGMKSLPPPPDDWPEYDPDRGW